MDKKAIGVVRFMRLSTGEYVIGEVISATQDEIVLRCGVLVKVGPARTPEGIVIHIAMDPLTPFGGEDTAVTILNNHLMFNDIQPIPDEISSRYTELVTGVAPANVMDQKAEEQKHSNVVKLK